MKNPICVADSLLKTQMAGNMSLGRIPPSTMVGDGAREWASKMNIPIVQGEELMTGTMNMIEIHLLSNYVAMNHNITHPQGR